MSLNTFSGSLNKGMLGLFGFEPTGRGATGDDFFEFGKYRTSVKINPQRAMSKAISGGAFGVAASIGLSMLTGDDYSASAMGIGGALGGMLVSGYPDIKTMTKIGHKGGASFLGPGIGVASSLYFIGSGYSENGIEGAKDAAIYDLAINAGMWSGVRGAALRTHGEAGTGITSRMVSTGGLRIAGRGIGAGIGASIGAAMGGASGIPGFETMGTLMGGMIGGAPIRNIARHPLMFAAAGTAMIGGAAISTIGRGASEVIRMANSHQKMRKSIQTDGSLAAFMTEGATTMRSRAVQAIQRSHMNARSALGREANFMHYPSRNYHSNYRM
jgi:hypothetical protein